MLVDFDSVIIVYLIAFGILMIGVRVKNGIRKQFAWGKYLCYLVFGLYISFVLATTVFPVEIPPYQMGLEPNAYVNLKLFRFFREPFTSATIINVVGNICLFIPFYTLFSLCSFRNQLTFKGNCIFSFLASLCIEGIQLLENMTGLSSIFIRMVDVNDLLLNLIGGIIGYYIYFLYKRIAGKEKVGK